MAHRDDEFEPRLGVPRAKGRGKAARVQMPRFTTRVLRAVSKASGGRRGNLPKRASRPGAKLGRGQVAAKLARAALPPRARRVIVKTRLVVNRQASPTSLRDHLNYLGREGVTREGERGQPYSATEDAADRGAFETRVQDDRHHFRFIVSPEDAGELEDLRGYTRAVMTRMQQDLGTRLDWIAVDHYDTDNPHTHIVLRGKDEHGEDLVIAREYIAHGLRARAQEVATDWLGLRTEREIQASLEREVRQERWTSLDQAIQNQAVDHRLDVRRVGGEVGSDEPRSLQLGRLQVLEKLGLARQDTRGTWSLEPRWEETLRRIGERGDIIRMLQSSVNRPDLNYAIFDPRNPGQVRITGRVLGSGAVDELSDRGYLIVDGTDGQAHCVPTSVRFGRREIPRGAIVEVRAMEERRVDHTIAAVADNGLYRVAHHRALAQTRERNPAGYIQAHVWRLEALRRAGIVERIEEGLWRIPSDLPARGHEYDVSRNDGAEVRVRSHLPIEQQVRAMGATWLDEQLVRRAPGVSATGFGAQVSRALNERKAFLVEQGLALRQGARTVVIGNLLATLRDRELAAAGKTLEVETGLSYRAAGEDEKISGVYRRSVMLASGRFAMLDDGIGFTFVPWRPVIEPRLGHSMTAIVRGQSVAWEFAQERGRSL